MGNSIVMKNAVMKFDKEKYIVNTLVQNEHAYGCGWTGKAMSHPQNYFAKDRTFTGHMFNIAKGYLRNGGDEFDLAGMIKYYSKTDPLGYSNSLKIIELLKEYNPRPFEDTEKQFWTYQLRNAVKGAIGEKLAREYLLSLGLTITYANDTEDSFYGVDLFIEKDGVGQPVQVKSGMAFLNEKRKYCGQAFRKMIISQQNYKHRFKKWDYPLILHCANGEVNTFKLTDFLNEYEIEYNDLSKGYQYEKNPKVR